MIPESLAIKILPFNANPEFAIHELESRIGHYAGDIHNIVEKDVDFETFYFYYRKYNVP